MLGPLIKTGPVPKIIQKNTGANTRLYFGVKVHGDRAILRWDLGKECFIVNQICGKDLIKTIVEDFRVKLVNSKTKCLPFRWLLFRPNLLFLCFPFFRSSSQRSKASEGGSLMPTWKMTLNTVPVPTTIKPRY